MRDFAAIDFETANRNRTSVCSVGVVVVRNGRVAEKLYELIRPEPEWYEFTFIHGLTAKDTAGAERFPDVWRRIAPKIEGLPLVAHNCGFDRSCLRAVHELYGMVYPEYEFHDTLRASRRTFGRQLENHQLHTVAEACGYDMRNHHHALADAEACAAIAMKLIFGVTGEWA